jgi:type IV secretory pathway VirB3-like protein
MYVCSYLCLFVFMTLNVCMYACMYVCVYVCMYLVAADMDDFFEILRTYSGTLGAFFWTFDHQLVVKGSTGAPKWTTWAPRLDF